MKKIIIILVSFLSLLTLNAQDNVSVTFSVDMSDQTVSANGVHIAGSFQDWNPATTEMTEGENNVYNVTLSLAVNSEFQFKFVNGNAWGADEAVPSECGMDNGLGGFNRFVATEMSDLTLDPVCFAGCVACNPEGGCTDENATNYDPEETVDDGSCTYNVTFYVDMTQETIAEDEMINVNGTFNNWCGVCAVMTDDNDDNVYEITIPLPVGNHEYKFTTQGWDGLVETFDGNEFCTTDPGEFVNRVISTSAMDMEADVVCFNQCTTCADPALVLMVLQVDMSNETVSEDGVYVTGSFNDWIIDATAMADIGNGIYQAAVFMDSGTTFSYKFINGLEWELSEVVPSECGLDDGYGNFNRSHTAGNEDETLPPVCFSGCGDCEVINLVEVTFHVNMQNETVGINGVHLAGSFNDFDAMATPMTNTFSDNYEVSLMLNSATTYDYKFINGNDFEFVEEVPFSCGVPDGFGGYNRQITTGDVDFDTNNVCFSECDDCTTGINENDELKIDLYPNPSDGNLNIKFSSAATGLGVCDLDVFDLEGRLLVSKTIQPNGSLNLEELSSGTYILKLDSNASTSIERITIIK